MATDLISGLRTVQDCLTWSPVFDRFCFQQAWGWRLPASWPWLAAWSQSLSPKSTLAVNWQKYFQGLAWTITRALALETVRFLPSYSFSTFDLLPPPLLSPRCQSLPTPPTLACPQLFYSLSRDTCWLSTSSFQPLLSGAPVLFPAPPVFTPGIHQPGREKTMPPLLAR